MYTRTRIGNIGVEYARHFLRGHQLERNCCCGLWHRLWPERFSHIAQNTGRQRVSRTTRSGCRVCKLSCTQLLSYNPQPPGNTAMSQVWSSPFQHSRAGSVSQARSCITIQQLAERYRSCGFPAVCYSKFAQTILTRASETNESGCMFLSSSLTSCLAEMLSRYFSGRG